MTCKITRGRAWNRPDSPEKKKREKGEEKTKRGNQEKKWNGYENEKRIGYRKKTNLLYIVIASGIDFFLRRCMDSLVKHRPYTIQYVLESDSVSH